MRHKGRRDAMSGGLAALRRPAWTDRRRVFPQKQVGSSFFLVNLRFVWYNQRCVYNTARVYETGAISVIRKREGLTYAANA